MKKAVEKLSLFIFLLLSLAFAFYKGETVSYTIDPASKLYLQGSTNVTNFSCNCNDRFSEGSFQINAKENNSLLQFSNAVMYIKTETFDCRNRLMNRDLYKALKSTQYPKIKIQLLEAQQNPNAMVNDCNDWVTLKGQAIITLTNVSKKVPLDVKAKKTGKNQFRFVSSKDLLMTDFNITPPSPMLGIVKVRDKITIHLDLNVCVE